MAKGFGDESVSAVQIEAIVARLTPSCKRQDFAGFESGVKEVRREYSAQAVKTALAQLIKQFQWVREWILSLIPPDSQAAIADEANKVVADVLHNAGLRLEDHFRVSDAGICFSKQAIAAIAATGFPGVENLGEGADSLEGLDISRSPFVHPLSEEFEKGTVEGMNDDAINLWGAASMIINAAMGWEHSTAPEKAKEMLLELLSIAAPTVDQDRLLYQSRYDDRALLKLCNYVERGLSGKCDRAFNR